MFLQPLSLTQFVALSIYTFIYMILYALIYCLYRIMGAGWLYLYVYIICRERERGERVMAQTLNLIT